MSKKKYSFKKILSEYNKKYATNYIIRARILGAKVYSNDNGDFIVTFSDKCGSKADDKTLYLGDFICYYIIPRHTLQTSKIKAFILSKETEKLSIEIKILPSSKIRYAYLCNNYFQKTGSLGNSCMRHKDNQKALNFYVKNNVKIVVAIDSNNKIYARALLWEGVKSTDRKNPFTYLDRVYYSTEHFQTLFYEFATKNKWKCYQSNSARQYYYIDTVNITGICHLPYTDTFRYLFYKDNLITASTSNIIAGKLKHPSSSVTLTHQQDGGYAPALDPDRVREALTHNYVSKKDAVFVKRYKAWVLKKNIADINGNYYSTHDKKVVESKLDGFMFTENSVEEAITHDKIDKAKATHIPKYNGYVHKSHIISIQGKQYHIKDAEIICIDKKWYHISQCFINYDRKAVNKELAKQPVFIYTTLPETWRSRYNWVLQSVVTKEGDLIPKEHAIIAYNLVCVGLSNKDFAESAAKGNSGFDKGGFLKTCNKDTLLYQEVYLPNNCNRSAYIILNTGTYIINSSENRQYLKKFNNKYYIKQDFKLADKKQLTFAFMGGK